VKQKKNTGLDFIIDKLTNSIENIVTGDSLLMTMKTKKAELDIDYIGGQGALTEAEENALSVFFKQRKLAAKKILIGRKPVPSRRKTVAQQG
jgi:hypothetical protein